MLVAETWIEDVADRLGVDPMVVREKNMYEEGQKTHFNMELENCTLRR
jgi:xanthine dehydrogenase molybdopterin-binding subunit B